MHAYISGPKSLPIPVKVLGDWIRYRRISLGLSCARAAAASGIDAWRDLEMGLVPTGDENLIRSIATTLELSYDDVASVIASLESHFEPTQD